MEFVWSCCKKSDVSVNGGIEHVVHQVGLHRQAALDLRVTAFALTCVALFVMGLSYALYGAGTLPPTAVSGLGMFPYLGGVFFSLITVGLVLSSLVTAALSGVHSWQKGTWVSIGTGIRKPNDSL